MSPEQLAEIRAWATRLRDDAPSAETRAAARAILMLADELERVRAPSERDDDQSPRPPRLEKPRLRRKRAPEPPLESEAPAFDAIREARLERTLAERGRRRRGRRRLTLALAVLAALAVGAYSAAARVASPDLETHGPPAGAQIGAAGAAELVFSVSAAPPTLARLRWTLNGRDVTATVIRDRDRLVLDGGALPDGEHELRVTAPGPFPGAGASHGWRFTIDTTPPKLTLPQRGVPKGSPVRLSGSLDEDAQLVVNGKPLGTEEGRFTLAYGSLPREPLRLVARDRFGNTTRRRIAVKLVPRRPPVQIRSVHVTSFAWASPPLRQSVLDLVDEGRINSVELDLKDEAGIVGFDAPVPLGRRIGAVQNVYDLREAVRMLHRRGVWVVGRLVAFRDPIHANAAWKAGRRDEVVQTPDGAPYAGYGGFTNFASPAVRRYNIDVARAAAEAGIDDILYDYVRRPDGPPASMVFPGLEGTPEQAIAGFLAESMKVLRPYGVFLGASVFGVAATRPLEVAQDVPRMARELDYIAPMVYPSHWGPGEYDVADPNRSPYDIVLRSLRDFQTQTKGTGARVVPWLQDFSLGVDYGAAEVSAQIRAARDAGISEFLLWDPLVTYTEEALPPKPRGAPLTTRRRVGSASRATAAGKRAANELGEIPVIMYHQIRDDGGGDYDLTPAEFRAELELLHRRGYVPVRAVDLVSGRLDVPAGKTPVVLTFDDSTKEQLAYAPDGKIDPRTAIGIMLEVAARHPGFRPAGTFFVNREPFAGVAEGEELLRWLAAHGFELGNHTHDHVPLAEKDPRGVQEALVLGKRIIVDAVPGARVRTMALPLGAVPEPAELARAGRWDGESYRHDGVFLVGAGPAPSPFARAWNPHAIPRVRTGPWRGGEPDYASGFWLDVLEKNPERRYVSDGDPSRISFPARLAPKLAPRYRARANPL